MKKIGILTHPITVNYGGILQAICLYSYLDRQGYDVWFIQKEIGRKGIKKYIFSILEKIPFHNIRNVRSRLCIENMNLEFASTYIHKKTKNSHSAKSIRKLAGGMDFDAVIVGSDQVWRMDYVDDGNFGAYFLDFLSGTRSKKISYAASFGKSTWDRPEYVGIVESLLKEFDAVSVRESSGVEICESVFSRKDVDLVLDPTLLVDKGFYDPFISETLEDTFLVTYLLDSDFNQLVIKDNIVEALGEVEVKNLKYKNFKDYIGINEWVDSIRKSKFVVTDSFHGMVFSIIFRRPFLVLGNEKRGMSRFTSLLGELDLLDRLIIGDDVTKVKAALKDEVDYSVVDDKISIMRKSSEGFLREALK